MSSMISHFTLVNCNMLTATALILYCQIHNRFLTNTNLHLLEEKKKAKAVHPLNTTTEARKFRHWPFSNDAKDEKQTVLLLIELGLSSNEFLKKLKITWLQELHLRLHHILYKE